MKIQQLIIYTTLLLLTSCSNIEKSNEDNFKYLTEQFADLKMIRYQVPGFENLDLKQKKLIYYLSQASLSGRDIIFDQNYRHNLRVRRTLEAIVANYPGNRDTEDFAAFMEYTKRIWFSGGIHHHYASKKITPNFSSEYFINELINKTESSNEYSFPLIDGEDKMDLARSLDQIIFNPNIDSKRVNRDANVDIILSSANNYYGINVDTNDVNNFYPKSQKKAPEYGLNSKLCKMTNGKLYEQVYKIDGMYSDAIKEIVYWIKKAKTVAENEEQSKSFDLLIEYYTTGDINKWDEYCVQWVQTLTDIDWINGFVEVYGDAAGRKGAYESIVQIKDLEASKTTEVINEYVQWFEDNSSIMDEHKKENVIGVTYKVVTVAMESGDASPSSPIGVNLPNNNWIRTEKGSKSVSLGNLIAAYSGAATGSGFLKEFCDTEEEIIRAKKYGDKADKLGTLLHEVVGHASGKINEGVGTPKETLKNYKSTLEEARADLVALYYIMNPKLVEIGLMESLDYGKAEYDSYIRNGLMLQLRRIELGQNIEQDHMRNRQLVASWAYQKGLQDNVIEKKIKYIPTLSESGDTLELKKTFFVVNDYNKLQNIFGQLLREIQRITSEGDFKAGQALVENFGVKVDIDIHKEVLNRSKQFNSAPYGGFINPKYSLSKNDNKEIIDVIIEYPEDFTTQMMDYAKNYSFLPHIN
ncbi:MAG: dihydrofolate reductase [Flavobacteriales bacterium]|nr:dihydrofolate reductase [Flavobacteriales bacterium]